MKSCKIHFLPALGGDCFVIEFKTKECIIIDCGYKSTYQTELKPLLLRLKDEGCNVSLLLITHTDKDHIEGAIEFIRDNGCCLSPNIIEIDNLWYNGVYNTLCYNPELRKRINDISSIQKKRIDYYIANLLSNLPANKTDISANNCIDFERLCFCNGYNINSRFQNSIVTRSFNKYAEKGQSSIQIGNCKITILSPTDKEIIDLSKVLHTEMLKILGSDYAINNDSRFVKLCELFLELKTESYNQEEEISATSDKIDSWIGTSSLAEMNAVNKASIVVEIEYDDIKMLFTGDSESALWNDFLDDYYDVVKLSHHGTTKPNLKLLDSTKGRVALISTNGYRKNKHPEKETIARVIRSGYKNLFFNYVHPFKNTLIANQEKYGYKVFFDKKVIEL